MDLQRRWQPVLTEWLQQWDADDDELEPEEPLSDEEVETDESPAKRAKLSGSGPTVPQPVPDDGYPVGLWPAGAGPGQVGFNVVARKILQACTWTMLCVGTRA